MQNSNLTNFIGRNYLIVIPAISCCGDLHRSSNRLWGKELPETLEYFIRHFIGVGGGINSIFSQRSFSQMIL